MTLIVLGPVVRAPFTLWDDNQTISANPNLRGPLNETLSYSWTHAQGELYVPLTYSVWAVLANVAPLGTAQSPAPNPVVFHTANLLVHVLSACIAFLLLRRLLDGDWAACAGAIIFALHPVQTESVAWASGMKDLLCSLLVLTALYQYVLFLESERRRACLFAATAFVLAMLAKPTAVVTPLMAGAIALGLGHPVRRIAWSVGVGLTLCIPCLIWTKLVQPAELGAGVPLWARPLIGLDAIAFYLSKLVMPWSLGIDYGRNPQTVVTQPHLWLSVITIIFALLIWRVRKTARPLTLGAILFLIGIAPVLGFASFSFQSRSTVADHYLYISMLGVGLAAGWLIAHVPQRYAFAACCIAIGAMALRTLDQTRYWKNDATLFAHAAEVNPRSYSAYQNLAVLACNDAEMATSGAQLLTANGDASGAAEARRNADQAKSRADWLFAQVLAIKHDYPYALHTRAAFRARFGLHREAIADFERLLTTLPRLKPAEREQFIDDYAFLGWQYLAIGKPARATECFERLLDHRPGDRAAQRGKATAQAAIAGIDLAPADEPADRLFALSRSQHPV